jgi:D-aminopeptidase
MLPFDVHLQREAWPMRFVGVLLYLCLAVRLLGAGPDSTGPIQLLVIPSTAEHPRNSEGDILELADGRLALAYTRFTGGSDDASAADLAMRTSADGGKTWSDDRVLLANEGGRNVMSVTLRRTRAGEVLLFYLRKNTAGSDCNLFVRRCSADLETVGPPVRVTLLDGYHVVNNDRVAELSTGRLLVPAALHTDLEPTTGPVRFESKAVMVVYYSDDEGRTWKRTDSPITPIRERKLRLQEPGIVELANGELLMYIRTDLSFQYGSVSKDKGETWSEPRPLPLASPLSPATIERLPGGKDLVCAWNDHSGRHAFTKNVRNPLAIAISRDKGATWTPSHALENEPGLIYCYTSITPVGDRLLLSYLRSKQGGLVSDLVVTSIGIDWLYDRLQAKEHGDRAEMKRFRDYGFDPGLLPAGDRNKISDVQGVTVGHLTKIEGDRVRTGVTVIDPGTPELFHNKLPAAIAVGNGYGKLAGFTQVEELGTLETPIALTNTLAVGPAMQGVIELVLKSNKRIPPATTINAVVGETNDGTVSDIHNIVIKPSDVAAAYENRTADFELGSVGGGTGTRAFSWKGGIGSASRLVEAGGTRYTVGALLQTNFGGTLTIMGVPVGRMLGDQGFSFVPAHQDGSCMIVLATDAPLTSRQLGRIARRSVLGLGRTGSILAHGSGDYAIAFTTNRTGVEGSGAPGSCLADADLNPFFLAAIETVEESVYDALFAAETITGRDGNKLERIPVERVVEMLRNSARTKDL